MLSLALSAAALVSPVLLTRVAGDALIWYAMTVTAIGPALLALAVRARGDRGDDHLALLGDGSGAGDAALSPGVSPARGAHFRG